jgi:branched-chain amino acid transport system permease protein
VSVTEALTRRVEGVRPAVYGRHQRPSLLIGLVVLAIVPLFVHGIYGFDVANKTMIAVLLASGFYIQFALSGQFSLATAGFYGTGAFVAVWAGNKSGGFLVGLLVGTVVAGLLGAGLKAMLQRSPLLQFAIATLSFSALLTIIYRQWESFSGGTSGIVGIAHPNILGHEFKTPTQLFYVAGVVALLGVALLILLERSAAQRDWIFVRDLNQVARVSGVQTQRIQIVTFGLGAAYMGAAGAVTAYTQGIVEVSQFNATVSLDVLIMVLLGGARSVWGPAVGAVVLTLLPEWLRSVQRFKDLIFAGLILLVILLIPAGLTSVPRRIWTALRRTRARPSSLPVTGDVAR